MEDMTLRACAPLAMATWLLYKAFRHRRAVPPPSPRQATGAPGEPRR